MVRLGLDTFSLRWQGWTPLQQLDFCATWSVHVAHFSEPRLIGGLDRGHLQRVRAHADALGIEIELGMLSICPSAGIFDRTQGSAEDQIVAMLEAAALVGSPYLRCVVGTIDDRRRDGGIEARIADTLSVMKQVRSRVMDAGVKLAVENHAGDMQARELKMLVEEAGTDFVGVCLDAGNPVRAMEDPHLTLETLAPYVLTTHTRDSAVWRVPAGAAVAWTRMGDGNIGIAAWVETFLEQCPGRALSLEIIVSPEPRVIPYRDPQFWEAFRHMPAWEFERFVALADAGSPLRPPVDVRGDAALREREDVEASLRWTRAQLGDRIAPPPRAR